MPPLDLLTAQGRLLTDSKLRARFGRDPRSAAREIELREADLPSFLALDRGGLEAQARTLIAKRLHEVSQLLPETIQRLEADAQRSFFAYAETYWPRGHKRHLDDALNFARHLLARNPRSCSRAEFNRLRFTAENRRLLIGFVPDFRIHDRRRPALQFLYRRRGFPPRELAVYLAL